ncbi:hypothetical protein BDN70DRAFT_505140 [Pholiota conissans]|uniref:Uncharacterized protein n=1 Tax=Pholiota conissans TaxID=109636 RepID=A0A9P6CSH1_9AGAR|nr:hypothetical protein BDN70DRAFT_505140 [Pholiota conissans]
MLRRAYLISSVIGGDGWVRRCARLCVVCHILVRLFVLYSWFSRLRIVSVIYARALWPVSCAEYKAIGYFTRPVRVSSSLFSFTMPTTILTSLKLHCHSHKRTHKYTEDQMRNHDIANLMEL